MSETPPAPAIVEPTPQTITMTTPTLTAEPQTQTPQPQAFEQAPPTAQSRTPEPQSSETQPLAPAPPPEAKQDQPDAEQPKPDNDPLYGVPELEAALKHYAPDLKLEDNILYRRDGTPVFVPPQASQAPPDHSGIGGPAEPVTLPSAQPRLVQPMPMPGDPAPAAPPDPNKMSDRDFSQYLYDLAQESN